jgi:phenylpyruvate tautomerase PptA (4-oxalocrotonate tautomerase family)
MPFITVKFVEGIWNEAEQAQLQDALADAVVKVRGPHARKVTSIVLEEVREGAWMVGGNRIQAAAARAAYDAAKAEV